VQDAALHRLQAVLDGRHGAFEDDVGGIVEKPVLEHAFQRYHLKLFLLSVSNLSIALLILLRHLVQCIIVFQFRLVVDIHGSIFLTVAKLEKKTMQY